MSVGAIIFLVLLFACAHFNGRISGGYNAPMPDDYDDGIDHEQD